MNPQTGELFSAEEIEKRQKKLNEFYEDFPKVSLPDMIQAQGLVAVRRDLTEKEISDKQILLYSPCACGSGKKFKFCCHKAAPAKTSEPAGHPTTAPALHAQSGTAGE